MIKPLIFLLALLLLNNTTVNAALEYQRLGAAKPNSQKGYDFFGEADKKTESSLPNKHGGYDYYDARGNRTGSLRQVEKSKNYYFYDADNIFRGTLKKSPSGIYYYKDTQSGKLIDSIPQVPGKLGSLSSNVFQGKKR